MKMKKALSAVMSENAVMGLLMLTQKTDPVLRGPRYSSVEYTFHMIIFPLSILSMAASNLMIPVFLIIEILTN